MWFGETKERPAIHWPRSRSLLSALCSLPDDKSLVFIVQDFTNASCYELGSAYAVWHPYLKIPRIIKNVTVAKRQNLNVILNLVVHLGSVIFSCFVPPSQMADYSYRAAVRELVPQLRYLDDVKVEEDRLSCCTTMGEDWDILRNSIRDSNFSYPAGEDGVCVYCSKSINTVQIFR